MIGCQFLEKVVGMCVEDKVKMSYTHKYENKMETGMHHMLGATRPILYPWYD